MVDRQAFLRSLPWLQPYTDPCVSTTPTSSPKASPSSSSPSSSAMRTPPHHHASPWPPRGHAHSPGIILTDCFCCFHIAERFFFFSTQSSQQDPSQMPFEMAMAVLPPPPLIEPPQASSSSTEDERALPPQPPPEDLSRAAPPTMALFFRINHHIYLVDHTAIQNIRCPKVEANPDDAKPPPFAAFEFSQVTLRYWAVPHLSRLIQTQTLANSVNILNSYLRPQLWHPEVPLLPGPIASPQASGRGRGGGEGEEEEEEEYIGISQFVEAIDTMARRSKEGMARFVSAMETVLEAPSSNPAIGQMEAGWSREDLSFLLTYAVEGYVQGMVPRGWAGKKGELGKRLDRAERFIQAKMDEVLEEAFTTRPPGGDDAARRESRVLEADRLAALLKKVHQARVGLMLSMEGYPCKMGLGAGGWMEEDGEEIGEEEEGRNGSDDGGGGGCGGRKRYREESRPQAWERPVARRAVE